MKNEILDAKIARVKKEIADLKGDLEKLEKEKAQLSAKSDPIPTDPTKPKPKP